MTKNILLIDRISVKNRIAINILKRIRGKNFISSYYELPFRYQRFSYDCVATCLDMLGYDGHAMFPSTNGCSYAELYSLKGIRCYINKNIKSMEFFDNPTLISLWKYGWKTEHMVIAYKDKIFDPSSGVVPSYFLKTKKVDIHGAWILPFKSDLESRCEDYALKKISRAGLL
jgi:hypothetical protein